MRRVGGFCRALLEEERKEFRKQLSELLDFASFTLDFAKTQVFPNYLDAVQSLGVIRTGFWVPWMRTAI